MAKRDYDQGEKIADILGRSSRADHSLKSITGVDGTWGQVFGGLIAIASIWLIVSLDGGKTEPTAADRVAGFHCLSKWDGSYRPLVKRTEAGLRDPGSFEHIETRITPERGGTHLVIMKYRARNGFGGMVVAIAKADIMNSDCSLVKVITYQ